MALYKFITTEDIEAQIKADLLAQIVGANTSKIRKAEGTAIKQIRSKLADRHDVNAIFSGVDIWLPHLTYAAGALVAWQGKVYKAVDETTGDLPDEDDSAFWEEGAYPKLTAWDAAENYTAGNYVYHSGTWWKAKQDNTGQAPAEGANWTEDDPRDDLILTYVVDLALYYLHQSGNPRKIPELRLERKDEALEWLEMVKEGEENPDLPVKAEGINEILWNSNPKRDNYF